MPNWLEEFLIVTDASRRMQIALFAIPVVPSLVLLLGTFLLNRARESSGPLMPLIAAVSDSLFFVYLAIAFSACIGCVRIAAKEYRLTYKRLFG